MLELAYGHLLQPESGFSEGKMKQINSLENFIIEMTSFFI